MFVFDKMIGFLFQPSSFIAVLVIASTLALILGFRRIASMALLLSSLALLVFGALSGGFAALAVLENRFPAPKIEGPVAGIILLGGAVNIHISEARGQETTNEAGERVMALAALAREFPAARLILSGGASQAFGPQPPSESAVAKSLLVKLGVEERRIELEEKSNDTCANAVQSRALAQSVKGETWLVVTSASHMPRAMACFRAAGFSVVPYPVDFRTTGMERLWTPAKSVAEGLTTSDLAFHEWVGLAGYWLTGRTKELFPAP